MPKPKVIYLHPRDLLEVRILPEGAGRYEWADQRKPQKVLLHFEDHRTIFCADPHMRLLAGMQNKPKVTL